MTIFDQYEFNDRIAFCDDVRAIHETETGLLVKLPDGSKEWVPKSQLDVTSDVKRLGDDGLLVVTSWIAKQKGWI